MPVLRALPVPDAGPSAGRSTAAGTAATVAGEIVERELQMASVDVHELVVTRASRAATRPGRCSLRAGATRIACEPRREQRRAGARSVNGALLSGVRGGWLASSGGLNRALLQGAAARSRMGRIPSAPTCAPACRPGSDDRRSSRRERPSSPFRGARERGEVRTCERVGDADPGCAPWARATRVAPRGRPPSRDRADLFPSRSRVLSPVHADVPDLRQGREAAKREQGCAFLHTALQGRRPRQVARRGVPRPGGAEHERRGSGRS